jgi:hypothetical protein
MPASPSTISSCCLRGLLGVASPTPGCRHGPTPGSWRGQLEPVTALTPASGRPTWPPVGRPSSGPSTHRRPATRPGPGPARRNSGQGTRWPQPTDVSPERGPHSSPHTPLNAGAGHSPSSRTPTGEACPFTSSRPPPIRRSRPLGHGLQWLHRFRLSHCGSAWRRGDDRTTCCGDGLPHPVSADRRGGNDERGSPPDRLQAQAPRRPDRGRLRAHARRSGRHPPALASLKTLW